MDQPVTQTHLAGAVKEIISHFNTSQGEQNQHFDARFDAVKGQIEDLADDMSKVKLAVLDYLATDRAVRNLVHELQSQGIKLDEKKIFAI